MSGGSPRRTPTRRAVVVALSSLAVVVAYTDRVNISVAAVAMRDQFDWSQTQKALVLLAFYGGYLVAMFPSSWLANRFGGRRVLGCAMVIWSLCTLATPLAARASLGALIAMRVAMGIGEAAVFPAAVELFARWVPLHERARSVGWLMNGIAAGTVIGLAVSGGLVARYDWPAPFYAFGVVGIGLAAAWFATVADDPATDPRIGADERALLALHCAPRDAAAPVPWGELLPRAPLWAIVAAHFASTWTLYLLLSWLPSYFREAQGVALASAGLYSAGPWLAMLAVTTAAGQLSDALIRRGVPVTRVRQLMQCGGLVASGLLLLAARDVHSALGAFAILCAATGALGTVWLGYAPGIIDVAPRHAALVSGISNSIAQLPGLIGVGLTGWLLDVTGTYAAAFALTAVVSAGGALAFGLWFRARPLVG